MQMKYQFKRVAATRVSLSLRRTVYGVGTNDAWYMTQLNGNRCPYHILWVSMLRRCYSKSELERRPSYKEVSVCDEWLIFSNFLKWAENQDIEDKQLDKDIVSPNNKTYNPTDCRFIPVQLNKLMSYCSSVNMKGVTFHKHSGKWHAKCGESGKIHNLGFFSCKTEAEISYREFKRELIIEAANEQTDMALRDGLMEHARKYEERIAVLRGSL